MSYSATGTKVLPEKSETNGLLIELETQLQGLIKSVSEELNSKIDALGAEQITVLRNRLDGLTTQLSTFLTVQESLSSRIGVLEGCVANIEATTNEILDLWRGQS